MPYFGFFNKRLRHVVDLAEYTAEQRDEAQASYLAALALKDANDHEKAIEQYSLAIRIVPVFWEALDNRGLCYVRLYDFASAIESYYPG